MLRSMSMIPTWLRRRVRRPMPVLPLLAALAGAGSLACGGDTFTQHSFVDQNELYWRLDLNHRAILLATVAPYDTLRLTATPRNYRGDTLLEGPAPTFVSQNISRVVVTPEGILRAIAPTAPGTVVAVVARLTINGLAHVDTAFVSVVSTNPPRMLASFSIHPVPPDSAKSAVNQAQYGRLFSDTLPIRAIDEADMPILTIPGHASGILPVSLRSSDTSIVQFDRKIFGTNRMAELRGFRVGTVKIYASTTAFGTTMVDTLDYRVGWPLAVSIPISVSSGPPSRDVLMPSENTFAYPVVRIGVGGLVTWTRVGIGGDTNSVPNHIVFDDDDLPNVLSATPRPPFIPALDYAVFCLPLLGGDCVNGGNMVISPTQQIATRRFPVPGVYDYSSLLHPSSVGKIIVIDEQ